MSSRRRRSRSRLFYLSFGSLCVLFSLVQCSPAFAADPDGPSVTPVRWSSGMLKSDGALTFYPTYAYASGDNNHIFNFSAGGSHEGDILAVSITTWNATYDGNTVSGGGNFTSSNYANYGDFIKWRVFGHASSTSLLRLDDNTAYFKCLRNSDCFVEDIATLRVPHNSGVQGFVISAYFISGKASASDQAAAKELDQYKQLNGQDNSGSVQQSQSQNSTYKNKSQSLVTALRSVANARATSCTISGSAHGMPLNLNFCSGSRPYWLRTIIALPVAVASLFLSIHIIRSTFAEIEKFRAGL